MPRFRAAALKSLGQATGLTWEDEPHGGESEDLPPAMVRKALEEG